MFTVTVVDFHSNGTVRSSLTYQITKSKTSVGRDNANDIVLRQTGVSGKHATIKVTKKGFVLTDLKSTNGTRVNQVAIRGSVIVSGNDEIQIGGALLRLSGHASLNRSDAGGGNPQSISDADDSDHEEAVQAFDGKDSSSSIGKKQYGDSAQRENYNPGPEREMIPSSPFGAFREHGGNGPSPLSLLVPADERTDPYKAVDLPREARVKDDSSLPFPSINQLRVDNFPASGTSSICEILSDLEARTKEREPTERAVQDVGPTGSSARKILDSKQGLEENESVIISAVFWRGVAGKKQAETRRFADRLVTIGRSPGNSLSLQCPKVSTHHVRLQYGDRRLIIEDLNSTNGTKINGKPLHGRAELLEGDTVTIGSFECSFAFEILERQAPTRTVNDAVTSGSTPPARKDARYDHSLPSSGAAGRFPSVESGPPLQAADVSSLRRGAAQAVLRRPNLTHDEQRLPAQPSHSGGTESTGSRLLQTPAARPDYRKETGTADVSHRSAERVESKAPRDTQSRGPLTEERVECVRRELSSILDRAQDLGVERVEIKEFCFAVATALRRLFSVRSGGSADEQNMTRLSEEALVSVRSALVASYQASSLSQFVDGLTTALALLFPISGLAKRQTDGVIGDEADRDLRRHRDGGSLLPGDGGKNQGLIAKYAGRADFFSLEGATDVVASVARSLLFDETRVLELRCAVDEACANVIQHAFDYPGQGFFEVSFLTNKDRELVICVDDRGLPYDFTRLERGEVKGFGVSVMRSFCNRVQFIQRGREGKRVQMSFELPPRHSGVFSGQRLDADKMFSISGSSHFDVVPLRHDEASQIAKCAYRSDGYDHLDENIYDVAKQEQRIRAGTQLSVMAFSEGGFGIGHIAAIRETPNSMTGRVEQLAIVQQLRGSNMLGRLGQRLMLVTREKGMAGLSVSTQSEQRYQRVAFRGLGAVPTGYWIDYHHGTVRSGHRGPGQAGAMVMLVSYLPLVQGSESEVYLPPQHAEMLVRTYGELRLDRVCREAPPNDTSNRPALSVVRKDNEEIVRGVVIKTMEFGEDFLDVLSSHLNELNGEFPSGVFVDLPLESPETATMCGEVERMGFVYSSLLPQTDRGDVLRLQQTTDLPVAFDRTEVEGAYEAALKKYIEIQRGTPKMVLTH